MLCFSHVQKATAGVWLQPPVAEQALLGGSFDTRTLDQEQIFFALSQGAQDGHKFLPKLANTSVRLAIIEQAVPNLPPGIAVLQVKNSLTALTQIAGFLRQQFTGKVIALTGSSGKTTTKNWLAYVLQQHFAVLSTQGNFNNHIGCPISMLNLNSQHQIALLEVGASAMGEINQTTHWLKPHYGLLLNVGHAHLGKFGSLQNTYKAKLEIFNHLTQDGLAFAPANDKNLNPLPKNIIYFGKGSAKFNWHASWNSLNNQHQLKYQFFLPSGTKSCYCNQIGVGAGQNLSLLVAVCLSLGLSWGQISPHLAQLPTTQGRLQFKLGLHNTSILDDSYNANPESLLYLWQTMARFKGLYKISVVGELAELEQDLKESSQVIKQIPPEINQLFLGGKTAEAIQDAVHQTRPELKVQRFEDLEHLKHQLTPFLNSKTLIGIKGSRAAKMENLVQMLTPASPKS